MSPTKPSLVKSNIWFVRCLLKNFNWPMWFLYTNKCILENLYLHIGLVPRMFHLNPTHASRGDVKYIKLMIERSVKDKGNVINWLRSAPEEVASFELHKGVWFLSILLSQIQVWLLPNNVIRIIVFSCHFPFKGIAILYSICGKLISIH